MKLYHYVHCPFCLRVRMCAGFLGVVLESHVLPYNDEKTPVDIMGVKMLPILTDDSFKTNESLIIMQHLDKYNKLKTKDMLESEDFLEFEKLLGELGSNIHSMAMPYWIYTAEFDQNSREYFQKKKEVKRGPFKKLVYNRRQFETQLNNILDKLTPSINKFYLSDNISAYDILLASHLWGMYVVPEYQFPPVFHEYLQRVKRECNFSYHEDYWR
jgi:glutaredoxin 2